MTAVATGAPPIAAVLLLVRDPAAAVRLLPRLLPGRSLRPVRREEFRTLSLGGLVRHVAALGADEVVLLTDDLTRHERIGRLLALGALPVASRRVLLDLSGRRLRLSALRFLGRDLPRLLAALGAGTVVWLLTGLRLLALRLRGPVRVAPARGRRVLLARSELWSGAAAGGAAAHTAGIAAGFVRCGADLRVLATDRPVLLPAGGIEVRTVPPSARYAAFRETAWFAHALRFEAAAAAHLAARPVDLLYHRFDPASLCGVRLSRRLRIPLVLEYNGSEVWVADHWRERRLGCRAAFLAVEAMNLKHAHLVVTVSAALRDRLLRSGVDPARILVAPNGVDPERFRPDRDGGAVRGRYGLEGRTVVGFIGTFDAWHGAEVLARAALRVLRERPEARFLWVGDGPRRAAVESILGPAPAGACRFAGLVPQEEGPEHLAAMDVLAAPHVPNPDGSRFFGSPTKVFEYMAMGRGIVASRLEQIGEVLEDGVTALLTPPGDEAALAAALIRLIDDAPLRRRLGEAARRRAVDRHTWDAAVRRILDGLHDRGLLQWN